MLISGHTLTGKREVVITDPKLATFASQADTAFRHLGFTVVCLQCGATPTMANARTDEYWKMECLCSVRVLKNPQHVRVS